MNDLSNAIMIAVEAHGDQRDKSDNLYILHPLAVMFNVSHYSRKAAVLHDVVEDCDGWTLQRLLDRGVDEDTVEAVDLLTRPPAGSAHRPTYKEYIIKIANAEGEAGEIAREVKTADIYHNLGRMIPSLKGLEKRYNWALEQLGAI